MNYSLKRFLTIAYTVFFKANTITARITPKRIAVLVAFFIIYIIVELITWTCFFLDEIFFPGFRRQQVQQPVFIVGNPRSGTTFLHRLMAADKQTFRSIALWEILFAPSVTQRKIVWAIVAIDRRLGGALHRAVMWFDRRFVRASNVMHRMSLLAPEEDEYFLIHQGATIIAGLFFGLPEASLPFVYFDARLSRREKRKVMRFYRHCLRRHLHAHGGGLHILSKNPYFTPKVDALYQFFPDAKIIYLARNPLSVVPSYASLSAHWWRMLGEPEQRYPHTDFIIAATQHWYRDPVTRLDRAPETSRAFVDFHELIADPERVVTGIYKQFGFAISDEFARILKQAKEVSGRHESTHSYSLEDIGITRAQILSDYRDVFARWEFDPELGISN